jgi:hypothetical protein
LLSDYFSRDAAPFFKILEFIMKVILEMIIVYHFIFPFGKGIQFFRKEEVSSGNFPFLSIDYHLLSFEFII